MSFQSSRSRGSRSSKRSSFSSLNGASKSVGGRTLRREESVVTLASKKTYDGDRVVDDLRAEEKLKIAMKAKRRGDIYGDSLEEVRRTGSRTGKLKSFKIPRFEKSKESINIIRDALLKNMLFKDLSPAQLDMIIMAMKPRKVAKLTTLITEGDQGYNFYVIQKGHFQFFKKGKMVYEAHGGEAFGELALLYNAPRQVTVTSVTTAEVWKLDRVTFRQILASSNEKKQAMIKKALEDAPIFEELEENQIDALVDCVHFQTYNEGDVIIRKGDHGSMFYIIVRGNVQCTKAGNANSNDLIFGEGDYFGERALLTDEPRAANIIAIEEVECLVLDRESFDKHLGPLKELMDHNLGYRVLKSVPLLSELNHEMYDELVDELEKEEFRSGETIIKEGEIGHKFFIIRDGSVDVMKKDPGAETQSLVATLNGGQYFGEVALLEDEPRGASVVAHDDCSCFTLERDTFERLFGPLAQIGEVAQKRQKELSIHSQKIRDSMSDVGAKRSGSVMEEVEKPRPKKIQFKDLKFHSTLGTGTFGRVKLVEHTTTGKVYALKILQKQQVVAYKQQANVMNEKRVMQQAQHPFILRLFETYKDKHCLYMLLELVQGGELFTLLHIQRDGSLSNNHARFYAACVVDALHYLHKKHIVYRDLKPENLMIDTEGFIRVVDFGFAKVVKQKTYTLCGTPEYLAPELVLQKGHNRAVDYWAVGILIYEMLCGVSPFADTRRNEQMVICRQIVRLKYEFPKKFPSAAKSLVKMLLKREPHERLGMLKHGALEIKSHSWFEKLKWDKLYKKELKAPWIPTVKNPLDTSNFEPYEEEDDVIPYDDDGTNWETKF